MKIKKIILICIVIISFFLLGSCFSEKEEKTENKILLKWVMPGPGKQVDSEIVWNEFNKKLSEYDGFSCIKAEIEIIPSADYKQRFMLIQAGGTAFDIAGTYMLDFQSEVKNGTFLDITDIISEHAPDIREEIPDWALKLTQVNSRQYAITNYQQMCSPMWGYNVSKEQAEKYLDIEESEKIFTSSDILTSDTLDVFENYMDNLKKNGELNMGIRPGSTWAMKGYLDIIGEYVYRVESDRVIVENKLELDTMKLLSKRFSEWYKKGYIREDALSADMVRGNYDILHTQYHKYAEQMLNKNNKNDVILMRPSKKFYLPAYSNSGGNAVFASSSHPEEAVKLLELMYTKKGRDLYRLLVYGIENTHYKKISESRIKPIGYSGTQGTARAPYGLWKWIVGNTANSFETVTDPEGWNDYVFNDWNKNAIPSAIAGIYIDKTPIETELSQCDAVVGTYISMLTSGALNNWEATYNEALQKLKNAGNDKVKAYLQDEIDKYIESQK